MLESGETGSTFDFSRSPGTDTTYTIKVEISEGSNTAEDTSTVTVAYPGVTLSTASTTVAPFSTYAFTTTVVGFSPTAFVTFQWFEDGVDQFSSSSSFF